MKKLIVSSAAILFPGLLVTGMVQAATTTTTLDISATIVSDCTASTSAVNFGNVIAGAGASASGSVDVNCTLNTPYTIALDAGQYYSTDRQITDGVNYLAYTLADNATAAAWGDGGITIADAVVSDTGTGLVQNHTVDATLIGANVPSGTYTDIVNVTVTY